MAEYLYNTKEQTLELISDEKTVKVQLSDLECRLVEVLSNGRSNSWRDIADYVYRRRSIIDRSTRDISNVKSVKMKLLLKVKLSIYTAHGYGVMLNDKIYIR